MSKYDGIKNPDMTDEEFEEWQERTRAEVLYRLELQKEPQPGQFLGYFCCPTCHEYDIHNRIDMIRPAQGDLVITCEVCGHAWTFPLPQPGAQVLQEGVLL